MTNLDGISEALRRLADLVEVGVVSLEAPSGLPSVEDFRRLADQVDVLQERDNLKKAREAAWSEISRISPNFPMRIPRELRDRIKAASAVAGASLEGEAHRALEEYLAGRHEPDKPRRAPKGTPTANLNIRIDVDLRRQVERRSAERLDQGESAWSPKTSHVIMSWLSRRLEEDFRSPVNRGYRSSTSEPKNQAMKETS